MLQYLLREEGVLLLFLGGQRDSNGYLLTRELHEVIEARGLAQPAVDDS
jgi:hypothetical protein